MLSMGKQDKPTETDMPKILKLEIIYNPEASSPFNTSLYKIVDDEWELQFTCNFETMQQVEQSLYASRG
jgi:hypothetical protein